MSYDEYIRYHKRGDGSIEERTVPKIAKYLQMNEWDTFRLIYCYTTVYNIPGALKMYFEGDGSRQGLRFRTDRRFVRIGDTFERVVASLTPDKLSRLKACKTTQETYDEVMTWFFFARYATTLFLEVYYNAFHPDHEDNVKFGWERGENYTNGAIRLAGTDKRDALDALLDRIREDTGDNAYAIETSLCGYDKICRGRLYDGADAERMLREASEDEKYGKYIFAVL